MNDQSVLGKKLIPSVGAELLLGRLELPICRPCVFHFRVLLYDQSSEQGPGLSAVDTVVPAGQLSESLRSGVGSQRAGLHAEQKDHGWVHGPDLQGGLLCVDTWERK